MCDTVVVVDPVAGVWLAKNSDREPGEAQIVECVPRKRRQGTKMMRCTHVDVAATDTTYATVISRPRWMWGAEMGVNEMGVAIGNEAVFTNAKLDDTGLTGMDMLRLALERAASAREAVDVISGLLGVYGQGGRMGYRDRRFRYSSSFLIADRTEAWVLETAGRHFAAARVTSGVRAISNALTIEHADIVDDQSPRDGFARRYSDNVMSLLAGADARRACMTRRAGADFTSMAGALRDHNDKPIASGLRMSMPCAHASLWPTRSAGQTTASMIAALSSSASMPRVWMTGTSSPCLSVFKAVAMDVEGVEGVECVEGVEGVDGVDGVDAVDEVDGRKVDDALFWRHERLHRAVLRAPEHAPAVRAKADALEAKGGDLWQEHLALVDEWHAALPVARTTMHASPFFFFWRRQDALDADALRAAALDARGGLVEHGLVEHGGVNEHDKLVEHGGVNEHDKLVEHGGVNEHDKLVERAGDMGRHAGNGGSGGNGGNGGNGGSDKSDESDESDKKGAHDDGRGALSALAFVGFAAIVGASCAPSDIAAPSDIPDVVIAERAAFDATLDRAEVDGARMLSVQAFMQPADYATSARFEDRLRALLDVARDADLLDERTVVVLPEYVGTWLVVVDEGPAVFEAPDIAGALGDLAIAHLPSFLLRSWTAPVDDGDAFAVFTEKSERMAQVYDDVMSTLARDFAVTLVGGSIVLPGARLEVAPELDDDDDDDDDPRERVLRVTPGAALENVSVIYGSDGARLGMSRKLFPTADEQGFLTAAASPAELAVVDTPAGRLGVLVCADAWFPTSYERLADEGAQLLAVPTFHSGHGTWTEPWGGYSGHAVPADVDDDDIGALSEADAWDKYALAGRAARAGIAGAVSAPLRGSLWDLGDEGQAFLVDQEGFARMEDVDAPGLFLLHVALRRKGGS